MHMDIDPDALMFIPRGAHAKIGHLGADAGEFHQFIGRGGDVGGVLVAEDGGGGFDVFGFIVVESDDVDELVEPFGSNGEDVFDREGAFLIIVGSRIIS